MLQFARKKPPFGIAQIGKSFRNEITPGNFIFRTREFEQMEMEFFVPPDEAEQVARALDARADALVHRPRDPARQPDRSAPTRPTSSPTTPRATSDIEYLFPMGWSELEGIANRGDFDLTQHAEFSGEKLEYFDQQSEERYVPHVIEPAAGVDRATLAFIVDAYDIEEVEGRSADRPPPPPAARAGQGRRAAAGLQGGDARAGPRGLRRAARTGSRAEYDEGGSIGKRYRRQDEIGTPWGVTVDGETVEDDTVTLRDRDSLEQERVPVEGLAERLAGEAREPTGRARS